ncbi:phage integrase family protein [Paraburkholderia xenovorans LB400]|uniref:Bacteriophage integrase n=1 Tax=Paraburkholderia xenovorans (strain LB400) TaxID=266265 RepID=Q144A9_PARXL|nr:site-specific integrase [Paraburkholderia xenovorans]ABE29330.1 Putative bacteriophage integrase [Paraburkholderia xenovorans LB400]AIP32434.1 phage integrase family protein [Paraburkholderia xenovorans LB400]
MARINLTRELLDSIRKSGSDGKHRELADIQKGFGARITPNGAISFYYRYTGSNGRHRRQTIGAYPAMTVSEARRRALELTQEVEHSNDTASEIVRKRERAHRTEHAAKVVPTIDGFIDGHYGKRLRATIKTAPRTITELRKLGKAFPGTLNRISVQQVLEWAYAELEKEVGEDRIMCPASVRRKLTSLRGLFSHAIRLDFITANPVAEVMDDNKALFDEGEGRDQWLRPDMEIRLRAALDAREARLRKSHAQIDSDARCDIVYGPDAAYVDHVKPAVLVALGTGLRRGEQMQLQWPDVDFDNERIRVRKATSKGDRTRYVPMCDEVIQVLKAWKAQTCSGPVQPILVFGNALGEVRREIGPYRHVLAEAKIDSFTWHDLRHSFATRLAQHGVPIERIGKWLGHSSLQQTMRYAHHCPEQQRHDIRALDRASAAAATAHAAQVAA